MVTQEKVRQQGRKADGAETLVVTGAKREGQLKFVVFIDSDGTISDVRKVSKEVVSDEIVAKAVEMIRGTRFVPSRVGNDTVSDWLEVSVALNK